ncbi:DUF72 domain-containing protein [Sporosarcina cyprini]|uniref:DUF72 domain-containing protein n=1 Tax=Sporosarcina cyprini TaxID=2910523 RepID=UPI001EE09EF8|nr:DUF72 domain-containing protein [Sporosarcina cyprini]MCG3088577.1 DUF72 domain-containing protein [Sporosarcina cyprini]
MIQVGLTGWGDHPDVYSPTSNAKEKLIDYSTHFPIVELDSSFYAIQPERNIRKWIRETPDTFQFIVKAYQGMTGHQRGKIPYDTPEEMFQAFRLSIGPLKEAGKLAMVLVQFPPWFDCIRAHVEEIRYICRELADYDVAIEFRHQSWYSDEFKEKTLELLRELKAIHTVCDEPQAGEGSVPLVPIATRADKTFVRLHGRNVGGWRNVTGDSKEWRKVRYLYNYSDEELEEIGAAVADLEKQSEQIYIVFNNNSGGHAAENAKRFQRMQGLDSAGLASKQLDLFGGDE